MNTQYLLLAVVSALWSVTDSQEMGPDNRPIARAIALRTEAELPEWVQNKLLTIGELTTASGRDGFDMKVSEGRAYFIDQELYGLTFKKRHLVVLEELGVAMTSPAGTFDVGKYPALADLAARCFAPPSMNLAGVGEALYTILPSIGFSIGDGSKSIEIHLQPTLPSEAVRNLQERPLRPVENGATRPDAHHSEGGPAQPELKGLKFEVFGRNARQSDQRARDLLVLTTLVASKEEEWAEKLRSAQAPLVRAAIRRHPEFEGAEGFSGPLDQLPPSLRDRLKSDLIGDYRSHGFTSEAEAEAFFVRANGRATHYLGIVAALRSKTGFGTVFYALPVH